jgi:hypothetical protein
MFRLDKAIDIEGIILIFLFILLALLPNDLTTRLAAPNGIIREVCNESPRCFTVFSSMTTPLQTVHVLNFPTLGFFFLVCLT